MEKDKNIISTDEAWEAKALGADLKHAKRISTEMHQQIDDALGKQMISIRLNKELIDTFKMLGQFHGVGYQPLMRDALTRFADAELKSIVAGVVESQRKSKTSTKQTSNIKHPQSGGKKAA